MNKPSPIPVFIAIGLLVAFVGYFVYSDGFGLLTPGATYSTLETVNGYEIKSRSSCCSNNKLIYQYYLNPPGFKECFSKCVFSTAKEAKEYALSLPGKSIVAPFPSPAPNEYTINIWSDLPASAYIDNVNVGTTTPETWLSIKKPSGAYTLKITKDGYVTFIREITINKDVQVTAYLEPSNPEATATSTPTSTPFNTPGFESLYAIAGLIATAWIVLRKKCT